jgi:hypothetical protein
VHELPADGGVTEGAGGLTVQQAALAWPERRDAMQTHTGSLDWRRMPPNGALPAYIRTVA